MKLGGRIARLLFDNQRFEATSPAMARCGPTRQGLLRRVQDVSSATACLLPANR